MKLGEIVGSWAAGLFLMAVGGGWLAMAYYLSGFSPMGTNPTVLGLSILGAVVVLFGLFGVIRGVASLARPAALPKGSAGWRDDGERSASDSGFDPDAALARYLKNRPADEPESAPEPPARPAFGRKQI